MKPKNALVFTTLLVLSIILLNGSHDETPIKKIIAPAINESYATMLIPAIDENGNGLATNLSVEIRAGSGRSLVDINGLFFWIDTQNSIRTAKDVAEKFTGIDTKNYDIIYSIVTDASAVEGPSAGAAIAIATIAALENKKLRHDVMITGTINADGSIGKVSDIAQKAIAAKNSNATLFLVPIDQSTQTISGYEKICKSYVVSELCSSQWKTTKVNVGKDAGIRVVEVKNIDGAISYMVVQ
ncbi:MAG: hypothetical protein HYT71_03245 [Candidatus Aenigmarchaeota archaeon]|nr:hypothetical protein [Candidatus Aenigmarchaeota archaeon]